LHPDLIGRLSKEVSKTATHVWVSAFVHSTTAHRST
jgi:hypothetical protein